MRAYAGLCGLMWGLRGLMGAGWGLYLVSSGMGLQICSRPRGDGPWVVLFDVNVDNPLVQNDAFSVMAVCLDLFF